PDGRSMLRNRPRPAPRAAQRKGTPMTGLTRLDHVNIWTSDLQRLIRFYRDMLGLRPGPRPDFPFGGAWLYLGDQAAVHLVEVETQPTPGQVQLSHFAFQSNGRLEDFLAHLDQHGIKTELGRPPRSGLVQVNFHDPDGNHIHVDFFDGTT